MCNGILHECRLGKKCMLSHTIPSFLPRPCPSFAPRSTCIAWSLAIGAILQLACFRWFHNVYAKRGYTIFFNLVGRMKLVGRPVSAMTHRVPSECPCLHENPGQSCWEKTSPIAWSVHCLHEIYIIYEMQTLCTMGDECYCNPYACWLVLSWGPIFCWLPCLVKDHYICL